MPLMSNTPEQITVKPRKTVELLNNGTMVKVRVSLQQCMCASRRLARSAPF